MIVRLWKYLEARERAWRLSWGNDISTPAGRRAALRHLDWVDHGILRRVWTNEAEIAPGIWRANQPSPARLERYARQGFRTVLNLRGESRHSFHILEREACQRLGLNLVSVPTKSDRLPPRETIFHLERLLRTLERPLVFHCKSGADRAGFVAALYLMLVEGQPVERARRQLSLRYAHLRISPKGVLDYALDRYAAANRARPQSFREWLNGPEYDPDRLLADFRAGRKYWPLGR